MSMPARDSVYEIYQQHFDSFDVGLKALNSQCKTLKRISKDYPSIVFIMGLSEHDGKQSKKINVNTGKRGRPKFEFVPKSKMYKDSFRTGTHIHTYIGGLYAATVAKEFVDGQNKLYHKKEHKRYVENFAVTMRRRKDGLFPLEYVEKQSTRRRYSDDKQAVREYAERSKIRQREYWSRRKQNKMIHFDPLSAVNS